MLLLVVVRVVVVAIGAPRVVGVVVPIAAAQHTVAHVPVAPKMIFNSCLIFSISASAVGLLPRVPANCSNGTAKRLCSNCRFCIVAHSSATGAGHPPHFGGITAAAPARSAGPKKSRRPSWENCATSVRSNAAGAPANRPTMAARHSANCALSSAKQEKIIHITHIPRTPQRLLHPMIKLRQINPAKPLAGQVADRQSRPAVLPQSARSSPGNTWHTGSCRLLPSISLSKSHNVSRQAMVLRIMSFNTA